MYGGIEFKKDTIFFCLDNNRFDLLYGEHKCFDLQVFTVRNKGAMIYTLLNEEYCYTYFRRSAR